MADLRVKPAPGFEIVDPDTGATLPAAGATVRESDYWRRRLREGMVLELAAEPLGAESAPAEKPKAGKAKSKGRGKGASG